MGKTQMVFGDQDPPGMAFTFPIPFESKQDLWINMLAGEALNITLSFSTSELFAKYLKHVTPKKIYRKWN